MKLYEVEISVTTVIQANSYEEAHQVASRNKHAIMDDLGLGDITVLREITNVADLPDGWRDYFSPYIGVNELEMTIREVLEKK